MIERRRLRAGVEVEVDERDGKVMVTLPLGTAKLTERVSPMLLYALTEPIPREEATGEEPKVTVFRSQWDSGKPDADGFTWETMVQEDPRIADLLARVEALEERSVELDRRLCARITALEERAGLSSNNSTPAPAAADGPKQKVGTGTLNVPPAAADGPSAEEVVLWLNPNPLDPNGIDVGRRYTSRALCEAAIRLIRAGQEDTRPVLTEEIMEAAADILEAQAAPEPIQVDGVAWADLPHVPDVQVSARVARVTVRYPRSPGHVDTVQVGLEDVRAADPIRVRFDFARDGWAILQASVFHWDADDAVMDPDWQEVAFVEAWAREEDKNAP